MVDDLLRSVRATGTSRKEFTGTLRITGDLTLLVPLQGHIRNVQGITVVRGPFEARSDGHAVLLVGTYHASRHLLDLLPPVLSELCDGDFLEPICSDKQVVQDRLVEWVMVCTLKAWLDQQDGLRGWADDTLGPVLRAMHAAPDKPWTLKELASQAGVSRTTLANRFVKVMGKPPLTYLTDWRMSLAAEMLADSDATVATVARKVGYADAFGFSSAFKRVHGVSPTECRRSCTA